MARLLIFLLPFLANLPQAGLRAQNPNIPSFDPKAAVAVLRRDLVDRFKLPKASLWLGTVAGPILTRSFGSNQGATQYPLFSSTKLITASVLMVLVDRGLLRLEDPVDKFLPFFKTKVGKASIRQLLTHSSGLPDSHWSLYVQTTTLDRCVREIARIKALYNPGSAFLYGSVSYQVAARIAEVVSGKSWARLARETVLDPLGMVHTDYRAFGKTQNPIVAIAGRSNAADYAHLLQMLLGRGVYGFRRVLGEKLAREMLRVQNKGMKILRLPFKGLGPYGIGLWLDRLSAGGRTLQANHYGAFGFSPWLDLERGLCGVLALQRSLFDVYPVVEAFRRMVDAGFLPGGVRSFGKLSPWCAGKPGFILPQRPLSLSPDFVVQLRGLPPRRPGWIFMGLKGNEKGVDLRGIPFFIQGPIPLLVPALSDAGGGSTLPLPWKHPLPGIQFYMQALWLNPKTCPNLFSATPALRVRILPG